jgi:hypothetical protein
MHDFNDLWKVWQSSKNHNHKFENHSIYLESIFFNSLEKALIQLRIAYEAKDSTLFYQQSYSKLY